jgi:hypothetical protein
MIHERVIELTGSVQPRVFSSLKPTKIVELFQLDEGTPPTLGMRTADVVDGFYSFLGFTRLSFESVIRKAIAQGVLDGIFGYVTGAAPTLGADGKYQMPLGKARLSVWVADDEIDLESGYLMVPQAVPSPAQQPISIAGDEGGLTEEPRARRRRFRRRANLSSHLKPHSRSALQPTGVSYSRLGMPSRISPTCAEQ